MSKNLFFLLLFSVVILQAPCLRVQSRESDRENDPHVT